MACARLATPILSKIKSARDSELVLPLMQPAAFTAAVAPLYAAATGELNTLADAVRTYLGEVRNEGQFAGVDCMVRT